jgi:hypothetical protein
MQGPGGVHVYARGEDLRNGYEGYSVKGVRHVFSPGEKEKIWKGVVRYVGDVDEVREEVARRVKMKERADGKGFGTTSTPQQTS